MPQTILDEITNCYASVSRHSTNVVQKNLDFRNGDLEIFLECSRHG